MGVLGLELGLVRVKLGIRVGNRIRVRNKVSSSNSAIL